jgi:hypothetical protein
MSARLDLHQHLTVRAVSRLGADVQVLVADSDGVPRWISWSFDDAGTAKRRVRIVERWRKRATPLTFVRGNGESALVDDEQLFRAACASASDASRRRSGGD